MEKNSFWPITAFIICKRVIFLLNQFYLACAPIIYSDVSGITGSIGHVFC